LQSDNDVVIIATDKMNKIGVVYSWIGKE